MADYKNLVPHIDIDRSTDAVEVLEFKGLGDLRVLDFLHDIENNNDPIEIHLIRSLSYKEMIILGLKKANNSEPWDFLKEEQKTFGGSKIFYINLDFSKIMILALPNEMENKIRMAINRLNKINEKISRINFRIKKENIEIYASKIKSKEIVAKAKDEIINLINQNLKV